MPNKNFKLVILFLLFCLFVSFYLVLLVDDDKLLQSKKCGYSDALDSDLHFLNNLMKSNRMYLYAFDEEIHEKNGPSNRFSTCLKQNFTFAIEYEFIEKLGMENLLNILLKARGEVVIFNSKKNGLKMAEVETDIPVAIIFKKSLTYIFHILFSREENTWWFGNLSNDEKCLSKREKLSLLMKCSEKKLPEFVINKFHFTKKVKITNYISHILIPNDLKKFYSDLKYSKFIECNVTRSFLFKKKYGLIETSESVRFKHKAWKILSKAKAVLDLLSIPFWLSSGTCLGFFRECDIIAHSKDVDIGIFANNFNETIISHMELHGLKLIHKFGLPNDSLELSFIDHGGVKLDIFFFYIEENHIWNGGTQLRTGKKFKYVFPMFDLCWTLFCGLKLRVPCQTEAYIIANYGNKWFTPVMQWDWKKSPNNVLPNGFWPQIYPN